MPRVFRRSRPRAADEDLTFCPACESHFVTPVDWAERGTASWWIRLRCGECGEVRDVVVSQEIADRFDRALDRGSDVIAATLQRLERARMTAELETFTTALRLDLLDAADFAARPER